MDFIVDSTVYIDLMRTGQDPRQLLLPAVKAGRLYGCGIIRAEVLRGIRPTPVLREMEAFFDIVPEVPSDPKLWRQVSALGWELGRSGKWPPVTDLAIAACALRVRAAVISPDRHFMDIPGLTVHSDIPDV